MKMFGKDKALWGFGRIISSISAFAAFFFIVQGQPGDTVSVQIVDIEIAGEGVIDAGYAFYVKALALVATIGPLWSKFSPMIALPWRNK